MSLRPIPAHASTSSAPFVPADVPPPAPAADQFHFQGYVVDRPCWVLRHQGERIALNRKSFDVLVHLIEHRDRVVSKDELLREIWPKQVVEESNLSQHVFLLRKAFARHAPAAKVIETVVGRGYRFVAQLESMPERRAAAAPVDAPSFGRGDAPGARISPWKRVGAVLRSAAGIPVLAAIFMLGVAAGHYWRNPLPGQALEVSLLAPAAIGGVPTHRRPVPGGSAHPAVAGGEGGL